MQIFVIGMHRSGTSMVCRLINMMGAYFGPEGCQYNPNDENPKGFWERKDFRSLNDDLLSAAGCTWFECDDWSLESIPDDRLEPLRKRARDLVFQLEGYRPWVTKEPRFCLTFPVFREFCEAPLVVFVLRRPEEVAASLKARNDFSLPVSFNLWKRYMESALEVTSNSPRILVHHKDLIERPTETVESIFDGLYSHGVRGIHLPSAVEINAFITPALHRNKHVPPGTEPEIQERYDTIIETIRTAGRQRDNVCDSCAPVSTPPPQGVCGSIRPMYEPAMLKDAVIDHAQYNAFFGDGRFSEYVIENVIKTFTNDTDLLIDGGANQGRHTLIGLSTGASVVAVEPIPEMCEKIRALVQNEDADRLTVLQLALSNSPGQASFTYCPTRNTLSGLHSRDRTKTLETRELTVEKSTIDLIVRDVCRRQPAIIKLDLEGGEFDAICGAGQTLSHTPVLIFEHGGQEGAAIYGYTHEEYYKLLKQWGYTLLQINGRDCSLEDFQKPRHWNYVALNLQSTRHEELLQSFDYLVADAAQKMLSLHGVETVI